MTPRGLILTGSPALVAIAIGATLLATPAAAQTPPALGAAPTQAAQAGADGRTFWTIQGENDSFSTMFGRKSDRYYTSGLRIGFTSAPSLVPDTLKELATTLWGTGETRLAFDLNHQIYTGYSIRIANPPLDDRPYAGVLMANFGLVQDGTTQTGYDTRSRLVLGLGLVGPATGGQGIQNNFHELIGQRRARGWSNQLRTEPLVQLTSERTWRVPIHSAFGLETDALPTFTASVGNLRAYLATGVSIRLGQGLQSDYGASGIRPSRTGGDHYNTVRPLAWYVFVGADGRAVGRDLTLEGNTFANSRSVRKVPFVGELHGGFAVLAYGVRLTYTHRFTTQEFRGQRSGLHQVGSLALSVRF
jgi:lipid A 3-O-deacylase